MIEPQTHRIDYWRSASEEWFSSSEEQGTAEAIEVIINAAHQGKSIKRVLRRMAAYAPQHYFGSTITFAWGGWEERSASKGVIAGAFYAYKRAAPQEALGSGIEPLTDTCVQMMRHTIAMYEASPAPRIAIFRLLALHRTLGQTLEHLSKAIGRLVHEQISEPDSTLESSDVDWIAKSIELYEDGKKEESLDVIFDVIDEMLLGARFRECDTILSQLAVEEFSNAQLLTVLTATLAAKGHLSSRAALVDRVKLQLERRGADPDNLLSGLE